MRVVLSVCALFAIAACGSAPVATGDASEVPASRVFDTSMLAARPGTVALVIKRDSGFVGAGCNAKVFVNGSAVADLATSEKIVVHLPPGQHMLGARHNCMGDFAELAVVVQPSAPRSYRISTGANGAFALQQTAF